MAKPAINPKSPMLLMSERAKIENPAASVMVVNVIGRPTVKSVCFSAFVTVQTHFLRLNCYIFNKLRFKKKRTKIEPTFCIIEE